MKKLFSEEEYNNAKSKELLSLQCYFCNKEFKKKKFIITSSIKNNLGYCKYCNEKCKAKDFCKYGSRYAKVSCDFCNKEFEKSNVDLNKTKKNFCSHSCNAKYYNANKKQGVRRSKLEIWLEEKLRKEYPNLKFKFNSKEEINSELDIYVEDYKLAFELNGIFHYEPIYGENKLDQIQNNDQRKFQACIEKGIELCIIDSSGLKYFKLEKAEKYYDVIKDILDKKLIAESSNSGTTDFKSV